MLHDAGKYGDDFQRYIKTATGLISKDDENYSDAKRGQIDHSSAGAEYALGMASKEFYEQLSMEIVALAIMSHHTGLPDMIAPIPGSKTFESRITNIKNKNEYGKITDCIDVNMRDIGVRKLQECTNSLKLYSDKITAKKTDGHFKLGMLSRNLLSCLIDADRLDTECFMTGKALSAPNVPYDWTCLIDRLKKFVSTLRSDGAIADMRAAALDACVDKSTKPRGVYTLSVPTGGGKTLSSLRFALEHARHHGMSRIIYVVPYMSIIDQNARVVRSALNDSDRSIVLEHHSSYVMEDYEAESYSSMASNWDAPIVFTTMVQFLNTLFGAGTSSVRRMHNLNNSVMIFDEIQALPVKCTFIFNEAINYLSYDCGCTALLCTATQPRLEKMDRPILLSEYPEIVPADIFAKMPPRTIIDDRTECGGWSREDIAELAVSKANSGSSVLVIMNTKEAAQSISQLVESRLNDVYYLSTNLCPKHRLKVITDLNESLSSGKPIVCVSTQVVEAGVDLDFGTVIRALAGWDSIVQAAGRCNRNGKREKPGNVIIVNPSSEHVDRIREIRIGKDVSDRILKNKLYMEGETNTIDRYRKWYNADIVAECHNIFSYPLSAYDSTLLSMLSGNKDLKNANHKRHMRQSFRTANTDFDALEDDTIGIIIRQMDGDGIMDEMRKALSRTAHCPKNLMQSAQSIMVNVRRKKLEKMIGEGTVSEIMEDTGIYAYNGKYDSKYGLMQ